MQLYIETERLRIRALTIIDAGFMMQLMNTPSWIKNIGNRNVNDPTTASNYIANNIINSYHINGFGLFLVVVKKDNQSAGICGIVKREGLTIPDLGFAMLPKYEGKGIATEASKAVVQYAKETLQLSQLAGITKPDNIASIRVLEKVGMEFKEKIQLPQDANMFSLYTMALHKEAL
jgi:[ribosomal protein S5]-alanine N-acetyltransferase